MKSTTYLLLLSIVFISACHVGTYDPSVKIKANAMLEAFNRNCATVLEYEKAFCSENIDYDKFYAENAVIKGTSFGASDSLFVEDRKVSHQELWQDYDLSISEPLNLLPGVNAETKEIDGSVRLYFTLTVTKTANQKSISIPMYESFDFDENGKIVYFQFYGDTSHALLSLDDTES
jgi:hypothetical protein